MIYVCYTKFTSQLDSNTFNQYLYQLPSNIQMQVLRYRKWQDTHRSLLGKMLLLKGLKDLGLSSYSFADLQYSSFQRPYFKGAVDFNISHSGNYVICAISKTNRIGIDIEEIKEIPLMDFDSLFSKEELQRIYQVRNDFIPFYTLWTQKEAYLKAIGVGLNVPLSEVIVNHSKISHNHEEWFLHELKLEDDYICHLSTDMQNPEIVIEKVDF